MSTGLESVESLLQDAVKKAATESSTVPGQSIPTQSVCPRGLAKALRYAVFPGGARIRPKLCLAVAAACGDPRYAAAPAAALELLHCASLVHDDLPCFDDSPLRRGKPSVHAEFGERLAVLTGDALIVMAFASLADNLAFDPALALKLTAVVARGVSAPDGIAAGQAWECEPKIDLSAYHRAKTGALFAAATQAGAVASGSQHSADWALLGNRLGEAYQVADDILDATGKPEDIGKPVNQDALFERPNSVAELGLGGALDKLEVLVEQAIESIPACPGRAVLQLRIKAETDQILPANLSRRMRKVNSKRNSGSAHQCETPVSVHTVAV